MNRFESVPTDWDDERDDAFFRIAAHLFGARYLELASLLLMANEIESSPV